MRYICTHCKSTSPDGNLWCQEIDCPAGTLPLLLNYGDYLGNIKILDLICTLPGSSIYEAEREIKPNQPKKFLLKVANPGREQYLYQEALALKELKEKQHLHPTMLSYIEHGVVAVREQTRSYLLVDLVQGDILSNMLLDNSQPWHLHVVWFMLTLCDAVNRLHQAERKLHLNLNPQTIMVRRNKANVPQPILLDLGLLEPINEQIDAKRGIDLQANTIPAYTPPELIGGGTLTERTDVYGLGLILYEMLAGHPAFAYELRKSEDVKRAVMTVSQRPELTRPDLPAQPVPNVSPETVLSLVQIVRRALAASPQQRYDNAEVMSNTLQSLYKDYGPIKDRAPFRWNQFLRNAAITAAVILGALVLIYIVLQIILRVAG